MENTKKRRWSAVLKEMFTWTMKTEDGSDENSISEYGPPAKKRRADPDVKCDREQDPEESEDVVEVIVGGYHYTTSRTVLLGSPYEENQVTYFQALFSGRWTPSRSDESDEFRDTACSRCTDAEYRNDNLPTTCKNDNQETSTSSTNPSKETSPDRKVIVIPDLDGRIFFYVLYFLQVGDIPRSCLSTSFDSLLTDNDVEKLMNQGNYLGLDNLVRRCKLVVPRPSH